MIFFLHKTPRLLLAKVLKIAAFATKGLKIAGANKQQRVVCSRRTYVVLHTNERKRSKKETGMAAES